VGSTLMDYQLIRIRSVLERTGLARSTVYAKEAVGDFPKRVQLSARSVAWCAREVDQWIAARVAARDAVLAALKGSSAPART
jgi:prophage regulatory protein